MKQKIKQFGNTITQKKSDQIMVEVVYLWFKLFFKSTFDILFISKIEEGFIDVYKTLYMKKCHFDHCYKIVYIIWISK
jgi:hypothetical protein